MPSDAAITSQRWRIEKFRRRSSMASSHRLVLALSGTDADHLRQVPDEDETVALVPGMGSFANGLGDAHHQLVGADDLEHDLPMIVDLVLRHLEGAARPATASLPASVDQGEARKMR